MSFRRFWTNLRSYMDVVDAVAIVLLSSVNCCIIYINQFKPLITDSGSLSEAWSRTFTLTSTAVATLFTTFITGRIQHLILRSFEQDLQNVAANGNLVDDCWNQKRILQMDVKWRGALGIDDLYEKIRHANAFYLALFTICGLITSAIVTALAPSLTTIDVKYHAIMAGGSVPHFATGSPEVSCAGTADPNVVSNSVAYTWAYQNGSVFFSMNDPKCPASNVLNILPSINTANTSDYVYLNSGTAVKKSAIGAPIWTHDGPAFGKLLKKYGRSLVRARQCVPILTSNPVKCHKGGTITPLFPQVVTLESGVDDTGIWDQQLLNVTFPARDVVRDSVMANWQWLQPNATLRDGTDAIGLSIMSFGAWDPSGTTSYTSALAGAMNDPEPQNTTMNLAINSTYVVTCTLDTRNVFSNRMVTLDLQAIQEGIGINFAYYLSGAEPCDPEDTIANDVYLATAARASQAAVLENSGVSGYISTILSAAGVNRGPPYAFNNSNNPLEDVLGLAVGIAIANLPLEKNFVRTSLSNASVRATRLGSDSGAFYMLLIPPLLSLVMLGYLIVQSIREAWQPGGWDASKSSNLKKADRYTAESLARLIELGSPGCG